MINKSPPMWRAQKATGGCTFIDKTDKNGKVLERFTMLFDDGDAVRLAMELNKLETEIRLLRNKV